VPLKWENIKNHWEESIVMSMIVAKWTIDEYHRMINVGILSDRKVELLQGEIVEMSKCRRKRNPMLIVVVKLVNIQQTYWLLN
jgi:hypothetical protein